MTRMHLIARIILTVLGVYLLVQILDSAPMLLQSSTYWHSSDDRFVSVIPFLLIFPFGFAVIYYLLFTQAGVVRKMVGSTDSVTDLADAIWTATGFRLALVSFGILITARNIDFIVNAVAFLVYGPPVVVQMIVYKYIDKIFDMPLYAWLTIAARLSKTVLGIYLLFGAPHYVKWQIEKSHAWAGPIVLREPTDNA